MGTRHAQGLLVLFLLGASWTLAQNLSCHKGTSLNIDDSPSTAFNWTTEKVETCDNGSLCQESALMIKAGTNAAILTTKGCSSEGTQAVTFVQHSPPPGIMIVSYIGPMWVKEMCPHQSTIQSRNIENGATTWFPISFGRLELLLLLLLL
uniref:Testis expressed 101 n=1 Tax=Molossus molossus TaxID=27622 RepID=A0A7J8CBJ6_MOLMO|nr:testis expressed 101 [Molossus molossus]